MKFSKGPVQFIREITYWANFDANLGQKLLIQVFFTLCLTLPFPLLSIIQVHEHGFHEIRFMWLANGYFIYCLLLYSSRQWYISALLFFLCLFVPGLLFEKDLSSSFLSGILNTLEGVLVAAGIKSALKIKLSNQRIILTNFSVSRISLAIALGIFTLICISSLKSGYERSFIGEHFVIRFFEIFSQHGTGMAIMSMFGLGKILTLHMRRGDIYETQILRNFWNKGARLVSYLLIFFSFYSLFPTGPDTASLPHMFFVVATLPLIFAPSLLFASIFFIILSSIYWYLGHLRWPFIELEPEFAFNIILMANIVSLGMIIRSIFNQRIESDAHSLSLAPNSLVTINGDGSIASISKFAKDWFSADTSKLTGTQFIHLFDHNPIFASVFKKFLQSNKIKRKKINASKTAKKGKNRYFEITLEKNDSEQFEFAAVASIRDVTKERNLASKLKESSDILKAFMSTSFLVSIEDENFKTVAISEGTAKYLVGVPASNIIGHDALDFSPENKDEVWKRRKREDEILKTKNVHVSEFTRPIIGKRGLSHLRTQIKHVYNDRGDRLRCMITEDVTELKEKQKQLEEALKVSENYLYTGLSAYALQDADFNIIFASKAFLNMIGLERFEDLESPASIYIDVDEKELEKSRSELLSFPVGKHFHDPEPLLIKGKDGIIKVLRSGCWYWTPDGKDRIIMTQFVDVTELVNLRERAEEQLAFIESSPAAILYQDMDFSIKAASTGWTNLSGYSYSETLGKHLIDFYEESELDQALEARKNFEKNETIHVRPWTLRTKNGRLKNITVAAKKLVSSSGKINYSAAISDVTEIEKVRTELAYLAERDPLTGLYNRRYLDIKLADGSRKTNLCLHLIDVDHFKSVNDIFGHDAGDTLLKLIAQSLAEISASSSSVIRMGGEEFLVVVEWEGWKQVKDFAEKIRQEIASKFLMLKDGSNIKRTVSIGSVRLGTQDKISRAMYVADLALRRAKSSGRNTVVVADDALIADLEKSGDLFTLEDMMEGLRRNRFLYHGQPIFNVYSNKIEGVEALFRWETKFGSLLYPKTFSKHFANVARDPTAFSILEKLMLEFIAAVEQKKYRFVSFNIGTNTFSFHGAAEKMVRRFAKFLSGKSPEIIIEISEKDLIERVDYSTLKKELELLSESGVQIALDNFGSKAINLDLVKKLPFKLVKLDRQVTHGIAQEKFRQMLVEGMVKSMQEIELKVIASGIENKNDATALKDLGIELQQGFYYGKPSVID